jgi:DNA-binding transcriptional MerR regulator
MDQWPAELLQQADLSSARVEQLRKLGIQLAEIRRSLAKVGAAPDQLAQLGEALDDDILIEIALISREATWQLRTLARQTRSRWQLGDQEDYPEPLNLWITSVQAMVRPVFGQTDDAAEVADVEDAIHAPVA